MPPSVPVSRRMCPNCQTAVPAGGRQCPACKLDVAKMAAFAAAKRAAQQRGIKEVEVEKPRFRVHVSPGVVMLVVVLLLVAGGATWLFWPKPPRYVQFPATAEGAAKALLTNVAAGTDEGYLKAYGLIADSARNPDKDDEKGDYQQVYHVMNRYLAGEFGSDWLTQATFAADVVDPDTIVVKVSLETLRIHVRQQTPEEKMPKYGLHYGVTGVDDFGPENAAAMRKMAGIEGVIRGVAGEGAVHDLQLVLGAAGGQRNQPRMVRKIDLLAVNRDPRTATWKSIIQLYPLRDDPVVQARLAAIATDERYDNELRAKAKSVLNNRVAEEDLAAAGVE